jgi:hypothetical protein
MGVGAVTDGRTAGGGTLADGAGDGAIAGGTPGGAAIGVGAVTVGRTAGSGTVAGDAGITGGKPGAGVHAAAGGIAAAGCAEA